MTAPTTPLDIVLQLLYAFVTTTAFAILFNIPRKWLVACGLIGAVGHLLRYSMRELGVSNEVATFSGALVVGLAGYWQASRYHLPRLIFTLTGIISMVPGAAAYEAVVYFSNSKLIEGLQSGVRVAFQLGAITAGLSTARFLTEIEFRDPSVEDG
jgi:uncharacterized membrane protein YjjB (DUF3815 family)